LVTTLPVWDVPTVWETLYPPPFAGSHSRIHSGHQAPQWGRRSVHQYVRIDLKTGLTRSLTDAPISSDAGWLANYSAQPSWSSDGRAILLPGTFLKPKDDSPSRPCVALVKLVSSTGTCVEMLKGRSEHGPAEGYHLITRVGFADRGASRIRLTFIDREDGSIQTEEYEQTANGAWHVVEQRNGDARAKHEDLLVTVKQNVDESPRLVVADKRTSRLVWDPNPQLNEVQLGQAGVYKWKDAAGQDWKGGLYLPSNYRPGQRYPLVIQTHGFEESAFRPSGVFPTAFAARALAAQGIAVLQVAESVCLISTPEEAPCAVSGYEAAVNELVSQGIADPDNIGIIGFSRTCFYVMEALTTSSLHFKAASITDGVMVTYFQYLLQPVSARAADSDWRAWSYTSEAARGARTRCHAQRRLAGPNYNVPVFEPDARRLLMKIQPLAMHYEVRANNF
jgi:hypothetical protein